MLTQLILFAVALALVIKGATMATTSAEKVAQSLHVSQFTVGFIVVALISILPETFIAINSALTGNPSFGLGTLFGSNVADLTLLFAILVFVGRRSLKVESRILKYHVAYPFILLVPLLLGLNGHYTRLEGLALLVVGIAFYIITLRKGQVATPPTTEAKAGRTKHLMLLGLSMLLLLVGAYLTVETSIALATLLNINPILIGMLVVGLGTILPELFFSLKAIKKHEDSLAIGDVLGTVLADATIVVGIIAIISPFAFPQKIIYVTGVFMLIAALTLFYFMKTGKHLTKREAFALFALWLMFVFVELSATL